VVLKFSQSKLKTDKLGFSFVVIFELTFLSQAKLKIVTYSLSWKEMKITNANVL
jgi:hypothetical protein